MPACAVSRRASARGRLSSVPVGGIMHIQHERRTHMKRAGLWAIGIGMLCIVGILTVRSGYSDGPKCSVKTLKGTYLVSGIQYMVTPGTPTVELYIAVAARTIYNGDGTSTNFARFTI